MIAYTSLLVFLILVRLIILERQSKTRFWLYLTWQAVVPVSSNKFSCAILLSLIFHFKLLILIFLHRLAFTLSCWSGQPFCKSTDFCLVFGEFLRLFIHMLLLDECDLVILHWDMIFRDCLSFYASIRIAINIFNFPILPIFWSLFPKI